MGGNDYCQPETLVLAQMPCLIQNYSCAKTVNNRIQTTRVVRCIIARYVIGFVIICENVSCAVDIICVPYDIETMISFIKFIPANSCTDWTVPNQSACVLQTFACYHAVVIYCNYNIYTFRAVEFGCPNQFAIVTLAVYSVVYMLLT